MGVRVLYQRVFIKVQVKRPGNAKRKCSPAMPSVPSQQKKKHHPPGATHKACARVTRYAKHLLFFIPPVSVEEDVRRASARVSSVTLCSVTSPVVLRRGFQLLLR